MFKDINNLLNTLLIIAGLCMTIAAMGVMVEKRSEGFEATVVFLLMAILCLLWAQTPIR